VTDGLNSQDRWLHDLAKPFVRTDRPDRSNYIKHDLLGKEMVLRITLHLKWSNARTEQVAHLVLNHLQETSRLRPTDNAAKA
jgi:hypothetical protein